MVHARAAIGRGPDFTFQPWEFGAPYRKRTCMWTKNLPRLKPIEGATPALAVAAVHQAGPSKDRWKDRSRTYAPVAAAMAG